MKITPLPVEGSSSISNTFIGESSNAFYNRNVINNNSNSNNKKRKLDEEEEEEEERRKK